MLKSLVLAIVALALSLHGYAAETDKLVARIDAAHAVLHELMDVLDRDIPDNIAVKAKCIAVVPGFKKGAFLVGAQYGRESSAAGHRMAGALLSSSRWLERASGFRSEPSPPTSFWLQSITADFSGSLRIS